MLDHGFLFCPLRKKAVAALPEERVRQSLIEKMHKELGYPLGTMVVERALHQLPHLRAVCGLPKRRADLIVLAGGLHPSYPLFPLLLVECKAVALTDKVLRQVVGYNRFAGAPFISIVNQTTTLFGWFDQKKADFTFQDTFDPYSSLFQKLSHIQTSSHLFLNPEKMRCP